MEHQDWKPVILRKDDSKKNQRTPQPRRPDSTGVNKRKLEEDPNYKLPTITSEMGKQIVEARVAKKLNQQQLAQKCNLDVGIIKEYEQGRGIYNRPNLNKIGKALGIHISR